MTAANLVARAKERQTGLARGHSPFDVHMTISAPAQAAAQWVPCVVAAINRAVVGVSTANIAEPYARSQSDGNGRTYGPIDT